MRVSAVLALLAVAAMLLQVASAQKYKCCSPCRDTVARVEMWNSSYCCSDGTMSFATETVTNATTNATETVNLCYCSKKPQCTTIVECASGQCSRKTNAGAFIGTAIFFVVGGLALMYCTSIKKVQHDFSHPVEAAPAAAAAASPVAAVAVQMSNVSGSGYAKFDDEPERPEDILSK